MKENFAGFQAHRKRGKSARASPTPHHTLNEERSAHFTAQPLSALLASDFFSYAVENGQNPGADPGFFLGGRALVSCSTSTPINHIVFFLQNTSCIRKPQVISLGGRRGGGGHPLYPPPRSAPGISTANCKCVRPIEALIYMRCGE